MLRACAVVLRSLKRPPPPWRHRHRHRLTLDLLQPAQRRLNTTSAVNDALAHVPPGSRIAVGLSGGVDSSVTALLLKERGFDVVGCHMVNWDESDEAGSSTEKRQCTTAKEEFEAVQALGKRLGIPVEQANFVREYWTNVFEPLVEGYTAGVTPNPDIDCNREIKFSRFVDYARERLGAEYVATGHYARLAHAAKNDRAPLLVPSDDAIKDQTYFLSGVDGSAGLARALFPVGGMPKAEVREIAQANGLSDFAEKRESQGICFIGKRNFKDFISQYAEQEEGDFVSVEDGSLIGKHSGLPGYTVGQRIRLGGQREKWFVAGKDAESNTVSVAPGTLHPALFHDTAYVRLGKGAGAFSWIGGEAPKEIGVVGGEGSGGGDGGQALRLRCKIRHSPEFSACRVAVVVAGEESETSGVVGAADAGATAEKLLRVDFELPVRGLAPGQNLVLYVPPRAGESGDDVAQIEIPRGLSAGGAELAAEKGWCLGGGPVLSRGKSLFEQGRELPDAFDENLR